MKKFLLFTLITLVLFGAVFCIYWEFIRQGEYMVFIESFEHGIMTIDSDNTTGTDQKYRVVCKNGENITININPERTDSTYYDLAKLTVNGVDVTDQVNMLQYKTTVTQKLTVLAYFEEGERPEGYTTQASTLEIETTDIINPCEDPYIGSYAAYDIKDPSIIYDEKSGYYYCFGSDNVVVRSTDLINWGGRTTYFRHPENAQNNAVMTFSSFDCVAQWARTHGYDNDETYSDYNQDRTPLAPDIVKIGDTYYLYFSLSKTADANESAIFCVKTKDLQQAIEQKQWEEVGLVISSCGRHAGTQTNTSSDGTRTKSSVSAHYDAANAVHPNVVVTDKGVYMSYGATYGKDEINGAIYLVELDSATGLLKKSGSYSSEGEQISTLHGADVFNTGTLIARPGRIPALSKKEGSLVSGSEIFYHQESGYYYLLVTYGVESSNYNIRVARSKSIGGPYEDFTGQSMSEFTKKYKESQYTKGTLLIGGYTFNSSSKGSVLYTNIGKASVGSPCVFTTSEGKQVLSSQAQVYFKIDSLVTTGAALAEENELGVKAAPSLEVRELLWTADGWPMAAPETFTGSYATSDVELDDLYGNWDVIVFNRDGDKKDYTAVERSEAEKVTIYSQAIVTATDIDEGNSLNMDGSFKKVGSHYNVTINGVEYAVYPIIMWDNELGEGSIFFTGVGADGGTIWAKKNYSNTLGLYTDTFYYVLGMCDDGTKAAYDKKIKEISSNPSQFDIDNMTVELMDIAIEIVKSEEKK